MKPSETVHQRLCFEFHKEAKINSNIKENEKLQKLLVAIEVLEEVYKKELK